MPSGEVDDDYSLSLLFRLFEPLVNEGRNAACIRGVTHELFEIIVHEQHGHLRKEFDVRGASIAFGDEQRNGDVNGLVIEGWPLELLVALEDND